MNRRQFVHAGLAAMGAVAVAGNGVGAGTQGEEAAFPSYGVPRHGDWVPAERPEDPEEGVFFTHLDWDAINRLGSDEERGEDDGIADGAEPIPIVGLPLFGALISPFAIFGIIFYPFAEDVLPEDGRVAEGVGTSTMTWVGDLLVFHGEFDPAVFADRYADGFEAVDERNGFTLYVGDDAFTDGQAYAVSEDALVVGMHPGEDDEHVPEDVVSAALDRYATESGRLVDEEDGRWLFETTGDAQMAFGAWRTADLAGALDPGDGADADADGEPDAALDVEANPVFDGVEGLINNLSFTVEDGEMRDVEARFSGLYPDDAAPSEDEVRRHLLGEGDVPHTVVIEGTRVHATATFEEVST